MAVKYLSQEWAQLASDALKSNEQFQNAVKGVTLAVQQNVTGGPEGDTGYFMKITDGTPEMGLGACENPDVTITQDYSTAVAMAKGELDAQNAFMTGKIKVAGNMAKLMQHQGAFTSLGPAMSSVTEQTEF